MTASVSKFITYRMKRHMAAEFQQNTPSSASKPLSRPRPLSIRVGKFAFQGFQQIDPPVTFALVLPADRRHG
jgi:hypothetical protein